MFIICKKTTMLIFIVVVFFFKFSISLSPMLCIGWRSGAVVRASDFGPRGANPGRCTFRCGLEQVTFTLLSTG